MAHSESRSVPDVRVEDLFATRSTLNVAKFVPKFTVYATAPVISSPPDDDGGADCTTNLFVKLAQSRMQN